MTGSRRRRRAVALMAALALVVAGGSVAYFSAAGPVCSGRHQVLAAVEGGAFSTGGPLPAQATAAMRAVRLHGFEGVWVTGSQIYVGVYGPAWGAASPAATAVSTVPGPRITYICETATERQLLATQRTIDDWPLRRNLLFSEIDVRTATVAVGIRRTAPADAEADLARRYGPTVTAARFDDSAIEDGPGTGLIPPAEDIAR